MPVKQNDKNKKDEDKKTDQSPLISKLRSRINIRRDSKLILSDITGIDIDSIFRKPETAVKDLIKSSRAIDLQFELESRINEIRNVIKQRTTDLGDVLRGSKPDNEIILRLKEDLIELQKKERLKYIISHVNAEGRLKLFDSEKFASLFSERSNCKAFVISMDIRRSTDLMLTAISPEIYAEFITTLTEKLSDCITENYGIFEKFTGDGVLAFFPDFYTGDDAFIFAVRAASLCHKAFVDHFETYSEDFSVDLSQTGLGIGIDAGEISLTTINNALSIVGSPVVYACRYSAAPSGKTFLTENAYTLGKDKTVSGLQFKTVSVNIKHEGDIAAYEIIYEKDILSPRKPDWDLLMEKYSSNF